MKIRLIIAALLLAMCTSVGYAQKKSDNTYNLQKAYDAIREEDLDKAISLLDAQIKDTPRNVEALLIRAKVHRTRNEYVEAMSDINQALKVGTKNSEVKTSTLYWWKATLYEDMGELEMAVGVYKTALINARKDNKDNVQSISFDYAQILYALEMLDESDDVYHQMIRENETDLGAKVGLARNMIERGQYQDALNMLSKCLKYDSDYSEIYRFQMKAYEGLGDIDNAIDSSIEYFNKDDDASSSAILAIMSKHITYAIAKVKAQIAKKENESSWIAFLCRLYEEEKEYEFAIKQYDHLEELYGKDSWIYVNRSDCYEELGMFDAALCDINAAVEREGDAYTLASRADIYRKCGRYEEAISDYSRALGIETTSAYLYYARGWCYELSGDRDIAMENYNIGIDLDQSYPYIYLMRGKLYYEQGKFELARQDFETVVERDTTAKSGSCTQYALHFLGKDTEALEWMNKIIESDPKNCGHYYDLACLYARMGNAEESLKALAVALEKGYCSFEHMNHDNDMDLIRDMPEYKQMVEKYSAMLRERIEKSGLTEVESTIGKISEISIQRHPGGTFEIPCQINSLPLQMIFDTGASDVTISSVEANFMLKNGYLSPKDIRGKSQYLTANGDIHEGTVITLKEVKVGNAILHNVDASVVKNQKAPLLLGQSVLEKFGAITIDNINSKLIIKH